MRILLTGATGNAGSGALRQAVADPSFTQVLVLARRDPAQREPAARHPKVQFIRHADFAQYDPVLPRLRAVDAALWCLGTSQMRVERDELHRITVDYAVAGATALRSANPAVRFVHLSGGGADPSMEARMPFAVEKGEAENRLDGLGLAGLWHCRPGYIKPDRLGDKPLVAERVLWGLGPVTRLLGRGGMITADDLGKAMLRVASEGHPNRVLENRDLRDLADGKPVS